MKRRVIFFGTPEWAVPVLEALRDQVILVITQPDRPAGRGLQLQESPVARRARELGLEVLKPTRLRQAEFLEELKKRKPEVGVVAAYGKILPKELLELPPHGILNLHPSLLPKYRGPAPVQWTLIQGEDESGVSIIRLDEGMDTGPLIAQWRTPIDPEEDALTLGARLRDRGIELLLEALEHLEELSPIPQPAEGTLAPKLTKEDGRLDLHQPARALYNRHRGVQPWPGSWIELKGQRLKVHRLQPEERSGPPGTLLDLDQHSILIAAKEGSLRLREVQPEGKRRMSGAEWARGQRLSVGEVLI